LPVGAAGTKVTTADASGDAALTTKTPARYLKATVANASGEDAVISNFGIGLMAL